MNKPEMKQHITMTQYLDIDKKERIILSRYYSDWQKLQLKKMGKSVHGNKKLPTAEFPDVWDWLTVGRMIEFIWQHTPNDSYPCIPLHDAKFGSVNPNEFCDKLFKCVRLILKNQADIASKK